MAIAAKQDAAAVASTTVKLAHDDCLLIPDDGLRHELLDGDHAITRAPSPRHQRIVGRLHLLLVKHAAGYGGSEVFAAPIDLRLSDADVVQSDVLLLSRWWAPAISATAIVGPPDLVVEVFSPAIRKRDEMLACKIY